MTEEWRDIEGCHPYQVSSSGRVRGYKGIMKPLLIPKGYQFIRLKIQGRYHNYYIHRLVAAAFIGDVAEMEVNHLDLDKANNSVTNLEICTRAHNARHAADAGAFREVNSRLSQSDVLEIRNGCTGGYAAWAQRFGVTVSTVCDIIKRRTWSWL